MFEQAPKSGEDLAEKLSGRILLQVESNGEAWYLSVDDSRRYLKKKGLDQAAPPSSWRTRT